MSPPPATTPEALRLQIEAALPRLSRTLQVVGRYLLAHADYIEAERITDIAQRCGTHPSAVVRFAKCFGFHGFHALKRALAGPRGAPTAGIRQAYRERLRPLVEGGAAGASAACSEVAFAFIDGACAGVRALQQGIQAEDIRAAVDRLAQARTLWIVGAQRAYPVAACLAHALQGLSKPVQLVSFTGALHEGQLRGLRADDALIAISFAPYAAETRLCAQVAHAVGAPVVALTDGTDHPLAAEAAVTLAVPDPAPFGFRALTNAITLAQSLFVALAFHLEAQAGQVAAG